MKQLENIKIPVKIVSLLVMLGVITMFVAWNGSRRILSADANYSGLIDPTLKTVSRTIDARRALNDMMYASYRTVAYPGNSTRARDAASGEEAAFKNAIDLLIVAAKADSRAAPKIDGYITKADAIHAFTTRAAERGLLDQDDQAKALLVQADAILLPLAGDMAADTLSRVKATDDRSDQLSEEANSTSTMLLTISVLGVLGGIGLAYLVTRIGITGPLKKLEVQMGEIARGDYHQEIAGTDRGDEIGSMAKVVLVFQETAIAKAAADAEKADADAALHMVVDTMGVSLTALSNRDLTTRVTADFPPDYVMLKSSFNEAIDNVRAAVLQVSESATNIRTGSYEIAQASEDLARRTEGNAASLEQTSAALVQIDTRLKATAVSSGRTVARADQAIATVGGGRATAEEAVAAMERVSDSARGIDSVIEGLDKIAFQTRVLAMNAAVEAGRAGDAGRGFAVVADLVSALAMRAEEEAKRARDQLTLTQTDIVTAVQAVQKVDGALANISGDVDEVHKLLGTMAEDATAQSSTITQISAAISAMDQSTQQIAAMVEETSAAARNLTAEVTSLAEQTAMFTTGEDAHAHRAPPERIAAAPSAPHKKREKAAPAYQSPVKALPAMAAAGAGHDDWNAL